MQFTRINFENTCEILPWFEDSLTQKYIGNTEWIKYAVARSEISIGKFFRGATVMDRIGLIAYEDKTLIGYIEVEIYDKYTRISLDKDSKEIKVDSTEDIVTASFIYVVNPHLRGKGYGIKLLENFLKSEIVNHVKIFQVSTDIGNSISEICLARVGFIKQNKTPNFEDVYVWKLVQN